MAESYIIELADEAASVVLAQRLAELIKPPFIFYLQGEIGAGKTTLVRAMLRAFGVSGAIKSPTFTLIESYIIPSAQEMQAWYFYHVDLYRLSVSEELEYIGLRDYLTANAVCCIEWPERASGYLPVADLNCHFKVFGEGRQVELRAGTARGDRILASLRLK